jgi:hypothetical protein
LSAGILVIAAMLPLQARSMRGLLASSKTLCSKRAGWLGASLAKSTGQDPHHRGDQYISVYRIYQCSIYGSNTNVISQFERIWSPVIVISLVERTAMTVAGRAGCMITTHLLASADCTNVDASTTASAAVCADRRAMALFYVVFDENVVRTSWDEVGGRTCRV